MISGIPRMFVNASVKDFNDKFLYVFDNRESIFITGLCGTGKTHLAVALGKYAMTHKHKDLRVIGSQFVNYYGLMIYIKCCCLSLFCPTISLGV